jgi:hypothetical protein
MPAIAYTVVATLPTSQMRDAYITWLQQGHIDEVVAGGAESGTIVAIDEPSEPIRVEARYVFRTRDAYDRYIQAVSPGLRAKGLALFPPESGIRFERTVGEFQ